MQDKLGLKVFLPLSDEYVTYICTSVCWNNIEIVSYENISIQ